MYRQALARGVLLVVGLTLRTAAFKHDFINLSDNMENRQAEVTADAEQVVSLNQGFRCATVDTHCVKLVVLCDRCSLGQGQFQQLSKAEGQFRQLSKAKGQFQQLSKAKVAAQPGSVQKQRL